MSLDEEERQMFAGVGIERENSKIIIYRNKTREKIPIYLMPAATSSDSDASNRAYPAGC